METLFHMYWWLLFPLGFALFVVWDSFLKYQRQKAALEILKVYAQSGKEPPADVLKAVTRSDDIEAAIWGANEADTAAGSGRRLGGWGYFLLFATLTGGFTLLHRFNPYDLAEAFLIAAVVTGSLSAASLIWALFSRTPKGD